MNQRPSDATCSTCVYWNLQDGETMTGECRAAPPAKCDDQARGLWPYTGGDQWCGSWGDSWDEPDEQDEPQQDLPPLPRLG